MPDTIAATTTDTRIDTITKSTAQRPRNRLPGGRVGAVLLLAGAGLLCNLAAGWLVWQHKISAQLAWVIELLSGGLLVALLVALFAINRKALVRPIDSIAAWASRIRQGDFSARLEAGHSGLYGLTDDINRLAEWLESLAELKNQELLEQAARLKTQTHIVRLLYDISGNFSHNATELMEQTIGHMAEVLEARRIEWHPCDDEKSGDDEKPVAVTARGDSGDHDDPGDSPAPSDECVKIPLRFSSEPARPGYGECHIWFAAERFPLPDEFSQLLYTLGRNIGMALERIDLHKESMRMSRMQERTHLANELHDSLAQTLAGLRFQVRILDDLLHQQEERAVWEQLENVENRLEEANAELRSLIGYFRAPIDPGGLLPAIESVVARFRSEANCPLFFQAQWGAVDIPEKWQLEIVRIIQEALTNVRKHSRASNVRVLLRRDHDDQYSALVEDDGVGMVVAEVAHPGVQSTAQATTQPTDPGAGEHVGLSVMAQRARAIGADFYLESEPGEGTRILLSFRHPPD